MAKIRKASVSDISGIQGLIDHYARHKLLLHVSREKISERIRDFFVAVDSKKMVVGCAALHIYSENLAEVRSLAVTERFQKKGIGGKLVKKCILEAKSIGINRLFGLTKAPDFFKSLGFTEVKMSMLPEKVYKDCLYCSNFHQCDEIAVLKKLNE